ncbi:glycoside hydrolase family 5 protein [Myriangium duriaei CBS 260.36]|uniref:glucan 1,3-beta-glucosidase n=1 Tax=Myriangium duriaei CBS 260.36 TaxID=1168546 RepID=A0A9P4J046_9PEZI|nr:glycoside hydrolase family 5 protein [Myriangium duriaei CBS 260.36]
MEGLAALNAINEKLGVNRGHNRVREEVDNEELLRREERRRRKEEKRRRRIEEEAYERGPDVYDEYLSKERREEIDYRSTREKKGRVVSGQKLERGRDSVYDEKSQATSKWWQLKMRGGGTSSDGSYINSEELAQRKKKRRRNILILLGLIVLILVIAIPVGIAVSKNSGKSSSNSGATDSNGKPSNSNLDGIDQSSIPASAKGTWLDPFSWYDTNDFNVTFTDVMVGGLPIMGLNSTWDDSTRANSNVPPLNEAWKYGTMPVRGINVGGWLVLEPVITPSFFNSFKSSQGVIDEYTLTSTLGTGSAKSTIEQHYSSFLTEQDFVNIQAAGFDHVRIPFGYWTIVTYQGDPYVSQVAWRYLLRAIEWARKYGIRVNLDLHGAPGSQNGWNHSGRQGDIGWLNGTDGALNANRTLQIHDQLSKFFAQDRYKNIIAFYGLLNEPRMTSLDTTSVLQWTTEAATLVQKNGINCTIVFGDGFMGLDNWQGKLQSVPNMLLDVHQYVIFNTQQLTLNHQAKTTFACGGWTAQAKRSMDTTTGFGPTIFAEWSQADTDCAPYLNNVGVGSRWQGTLNMVDTPGGGQNGSVLTPTCPTANNPRCMCDGANASPSAYSAAYKQWLLQFAVAQMESFEYGWGWFYWTWKTESAAQWSYKDGLAAGILPGKVWERDFKCASGAPDYASLGLPEYY